MKKVFYLLCFIFTFSAYAADSSTGLDDDVGTEIVKADTQAVKLFVAPATVHLTKTVNSNTSYVERGYKGLLLAAQKENYFNSQGRYRYKPKIKQLAAFKNYTNGSSGGMPNRTN